MPASYILVVPQVSFLGHASGTPGGPSSDVRCKVLVTTYGRCATKTVRGALTFVDSTEDLSRGLDASSKA